MSDRLYRVDGLLWKVDVNNYPNDYPICPDDHFQLDDGSGYITYADNDDYTYSLKCGDCGKEYKFPNGRSYAQEQDYVHKRLCARDYKKAKVIDIDGELTPIAKVKASEDGGNHFVTAQLMKSKRGLQLVVYAGEKGNNEKSQIFIEPEIKRLAFDQKDLHPNDVFTELKATFSDGSSQVIRKAEK